MPRQLRIEPHHAIAADGEIRRIENVALDEIQHHTINLRPFRLQSNTNFDDPSLPSCIIPIVGSQPSEMALIRISLSRAAQA